MMTSTNKAVLCCLCEYVNGMDEIYFIPSGWRKDEVSNFWRGFRFGPICKQGHNSKEEFLCSLVSHHGTVLSVGLRMFDNKSLLKTLNDQMNLTPMRGEGKNGQCGNRRSAVEVVQSKWWHHKYDGSNLTHISASLLPPSALYITMVTLTYPLKCRFSHHSWKSDVIISKCDRLIWQFLASGAMILSHTQTHTFLVLVALWGHSCINEFPDPNLSPQTQQTRVSYLVSPDSLLLGLPLSAFTFFSFDLTSLW